MSLVYLRLLFTQHALICTHDVSRLNPLTHPFIVFAAHSHVTLQHYCHWQTRNLGYNAFNLPLPSSLAGGWGAHRKLCFQARRLFVDQKRVEPHVVSKTVVKRPSFVEELEHLSPLTQLVIGVALLDLHSVKPVVLSPVWPRLELFKESVFQHLLKLVNAKSSG